MKRPLVSIGIPTYNRPYLLQKTLQNIINQTYQNLEIIISNNSSTNPAVDDIIKSFITIDSRIKYFLQSENIGAPANFEFVLKQATGDYFMWMADDDSCLLTYVEELIDCCLTDERIILCGSDIEVIDEENNYLRTEHLKDIYPDKPWKENPFFTYPTSNIFFCIYGLFKTKYIQNTNHQWLTYKDYNTGLEVPFLATLALKGKIVAVPRSLKKYRSYSDSTFVREAKTITMPDFIKLHSMIVLRLLKIILQSKITLKKKSILMVILLTSPVSFVINNFPKAIRILRSTK